MRRAIVCAWLALAAAAGAQADGEHDRVRRERDDAHRRYASRERECLTRFVAASCLDAARVEQRDTLQRLRRQELEIDAKARREAVAARQRQVDASRARSPAQASAPAGRAPSVPEATAPASEARRPAEAGGRLFPDRSTLPRIESPRSTEAAARNTARLEARNREAEAHREKVLQRNAEREARGKRAAPLPVPAASPSVRQ